MRRSPPPPRTKENFDFNKEVLVAVVAVGVAIASACLGFESLSVVPLVSSSSSEQKIFSAREGDANLSVPIGTATSCTFKLKR